MLFRPALLLVLLLVVQISLGILIIYTEKQPSVTTFHVMIGAVVLGAAVTLATQSRRLFAPVTDSAYNRGTKEPLRAGPEEVPA